VKIAYLGPEGTFTEEALLSLLLAKDAELVAASTVPGVVEAVASGDCAHGLVPIENSIEGSVNITLDTLAFGTRPVEIVGEVVRPIRHALLGIAGTEAATVTDVVSHPHASAQCRDWLAENAPDVTVHAANSTAEAARTVADRGDPAWAAIGTTLAADLYGLKVVAKDIEDRAENATRFVLLGTQRPEPTGDDRSSLVCFIEQDRPGSLLAILHEFSDRQINLSKLESRPTKERLGEYCFFIDAEGHADAPPLSYAIDSLRTKIMGVKILGSYPAHRTN
jgi:prephenate dehydratase